jgi:predicted acyl esterase
MKKMQRIVIVQTTKQSTGNTNNIIQCSSPQKSNNSNSSNCITKQKKHTMKITIVYDPKTQTISSELIAQQTGHIAGQAEDIIDRTESTEYNGEELEQETNLIQKIQRISI